MHPTQRRLIVAVVVTLACLPVLAIDLLGGHGAPASDSAQVSTDSPESSLVASVSPSSDAPTTDAPTTVAEAATTTDTVATGRSTTSTTAAPTTTTTAPKATAKAKTKATTSTTAPAPVYVAPAPAPAPPPPPAASGPSPTSWEASFLACVRQRESHGNYSVADPTGTFMGAYQIYQGGWDSIAASIGRSDLVGVKPNHASPADQDTIALAMLRQFGTSPWGGSCG